MTKNKHHYVPQFYLRNFASNPRRINLYNLRTNFSFSNAGLKDQCYRPKLYGDVDDVENFLARIETDASTVITSIIDTNTLPHYDSNEYILLMMFIALQMQRTVSKRSGMKRFQRVLSVAVLLLSATLAGCSSPQNLTLTIPSIPAFKPAALSIRAGQQVRLTIKNDDKDNTETHNFVLVRGGEDVMLDVTFAVDAAVSKVGGASGYLPIEESELAKIFGTCKSDRARQK